MMKLTPDRPSRERSQKLPKAPKISKTPYQLPTYRTEKGQKTDHFEIPKGRHIIQINRNLFERV